MRYFLCLLPSKAPSRLRLASQELCWWVTARCPGSWPVAARLARAGLLYPLPSPTAKGPKETASTVSSCAEVWRESRTSCSEDIANTGDTLGSLTMMMTLIMTLVSLAMTMLVPGTCCGV